MREPRQHAYIATLMRQLAEGKTDRRDFLRTATLLGLSASAAYAFVGRVTGESFVTTAKADMPKGGSIRIAMPVQDIKSPHTYDWEGQHNVTRNVCEYLTRLCSARM